MFMNLALLQSKLFFYKENKEEEVRIYNLARILRWDSKSASQSLGEDLWLSEGWVTFEVDSKQSERGEMGWSLKTNPAAVAIVKK